jgi:hypothetical protein
MRDGLAVVRGFAHFVLKQRKKIFGKRAIFIK